MSAPSPLYFLSVWLLCLGLLSQAARAQRLPLTEVVIAGRFAHGPVEVPVTVSATDSTRPFQSADGTAWPAEAQLRWFFENGGTSAQVVRLDPAKPLATAMRDALTGPNLKSPGLLHLLPDASLLVIPELSALPQADLLSILESLRPLAAARHFLLLLDPPPTSTTVTTITTWAAALPQDLDFVQLTFPRLLVNRHRLMTTPTSGTVPIGGSGAVAAITTRMDAQTGPWKSPTSLQISTDGLEVTLTTTQADNLNLAHICPLRFFSGSGYRLFGSRTRDTIVAENRFVPINRLMRWTTHSLQRALAPIAAGAVNNNTLWTNLRSRTETHLQSLFTDGALLGANSNEAYFVRCDATTMTATDLANGRAKVLVGMATLRPAEFQITTLTFFTASAPRPALDLRLLVLRPAAGYMELYFPTTPGFSYSLEESATLNAATWPALTPIPGDGAWHRHPVAFGSARRFYRLRAQ